MDKNKLASELQTLIEIMERLRSPEGCPWDKEQTLDSLQSYIIEESYEVVEAYQKGNINLLREELGDVLLQIVFQSQVAREEELFDLVDVIKGLSEKLIRRHPHVFSSKHADTPEEVSVLWKEVKKAEKNQDNNGEVSSLMEKAAGNQPALLQAVEVQELAAEVGFDWENITDVLAKVREEIDELEDALNNRDRESASMELGDLLFAVVNLARFLDTNPELALLKTILKFKNRFKYIEETVHFKGKKMQDMSLKELDHYWEKAKTTDL